MKKHISIAVSLILSSLILLTVLTGCNTGITDKESQPQPSKMVIFNKEYDDVVDFLRDNGGNLDIIPVQIAECFFLDDKKSLKQYYEKEEDWVHDIECIDAGLLGNKYRFSLDNRFILTGTDDQGRKTMSLKVNIYGSYENGDGESIPTYQYIYVSLVRTDEGEWLATGAGRQ